MTARSGMKTLTIALLALLTLVWSGLAGAAEIKLGKISMQKISSKSTRIKAAYQKVQQIQSEGQAKLAAMASDVQALQKKLEAAKTKADKQKIQTELDAKSEAAESEQQSIGLKLSIEQNNIRTKFTSELKAIIEKVANAKGLNLVLEDSTLLYTSGIADITEEVLKTLDKAGPSAAGPKAAPKPAPAKSDKK